MHTSPHRPLESQQISYPSIVQSQTSRKRFFKNIGFVAGTLLGAYLGHEYAEGSRYNFQGVGSYVAFHHPYLTMIASAATLGVMGRGFVQGLQDLVAPPQRVIGEMRDEMFGVRRNGK